MTRWLRAAQGIPEPLTKPTKPTQPALGPGDTTGAGVLSVKSVLSRGERPDPDEFEERAAIHEFDAGMTRAVAEDAAARAQGFEDAAAYHAAVAGPPLTIAEQWRQEADDPRNPDAF